MQILTARGVTLKFGGLVAVNSVSFTVNEGEIFSIIGPNGAGKTSLFNAISGVFPPTDGVVLVSNAEVRRSLTPSTWIGFGSLGIAAGLLGAIALNVTSLWQASITNNFVFDGAFDWGLALRVLFTFIATLSATHTLLPFAGFGILAGLGAYHLWNGSRRGSEVCARAGVARTFQNVRLFPHLSALDNVLIGMHTGFRSGFLASMLRLPSLRREEARARQWALEVLAFVGLDAVAETTAGELPYGSQRRLEIARALASRPKVLLLDEPAAGMNPTESAALMAIIRGIKAQTELGTATVVVIEHDMKIVMGISDRIVVLHHGEKIAEGTPAEIRADPLVVAAYLGAVRTEA